MKPLRLPFGRQVAFAAAAALSLLPAFGQKVFFENFDALPLGPNVEEASKGSQVWTRTPPAGWVVDDSQMPGFGTPEYAANDGRTEWAGWAFADVKWWPTVDNQRRAEFVLASGAAAIADPDEWDDATHLKGLFNSYLTTPNVTIAGKAANSLVIAFDSSWRDEAVDDGAPNWPVDDQGQPTNNQTAVIRVQFDGAAPIEVMNWSSISSDPNFHDDNPNESVIVPLNNPAGATALKLTLGLINAANDWWWAFDNLAIGEPPLITGANATGVGFTVRITEALGKTVNESLPITTKLDGNTVTTTVTRDTDRILVAFDQSPSIFVPGSRHTVEVTFTTGTGQSVTDSVQFTAPGYVSTAATPNTLVASINEKEYLTVNEGQGVTLLLDGAPITAQSVQRVDLVATDGTDLPDRIDVRYTSPTPWASGSAHTLQVTFRTATAQTVVETVAFTAPEYATIPAALATAIGTGAQPGMKWRTHQVATRANSIAETEKQLRGELGASTHDPSAQVAGGYFEINYVNLDRNAVDAGNFNASAANELAVADDPIPGIPGLALSTDYIAADAIAYVQIAQPGIYTMVVNSDDGFQVSTGNATTPDFLVLGKFDAGRGQADTSFYFKVDQAGVYLFRLLYFNGTGDARVEWFTVNADGTRALVNGAQTGALPAFRTRTVAEPELPVTTPPNIGSWVLNPNGSLTVTWSGGGSFQSAPTVQGPWTSATGATSPHTLTPTGNALFGRIVR